MSDKTDKLIKQIGELSVMELAELVKSLEEKFGVSASPVMAAAAPSGNGVAPAASDAEEKTSFDVVLKDAGANKIAVIKALREINPNLGLKEAKDLSEKPGAVILEGANKANSEEAKAKLTTAGATVELK
ncbi:MAG: 50S ribosomal protein L7/L12 [Candidatus Amesbacteria bacterium GW2011_GWA1_47_16]|uniref:Large ribosomal subunit protein bL12 n=2 Tax=Candidatus Amesiibacteriota TaxID=1752730 RepID=A0A1F4Z5L3_9BACT|nr:MAG: 50S ribosomal protein L7/L12 [Candidatus Amesbacteria bacterium GW2011_GWA1_47_16]OGC99128.1 MAG: 50S ribosomal protein L7/L12 [Candidatus Amesbacteria bacterium RIFCSPHIGHO2_01_FULL_47_34]OGD01491.1 MAG: 50S ribosomal protein L7/L12 [Candidatus Amesbacteria bacterium RIFCSPLOWO2_01_FULL_47_33]